MSLLTIKPENIFVKNVFGNAGELREDWCGMAETPNGDVFVLCDGLDDNIGGDKASCIAINSIIEFLKRCEYDNVPQAINDAIKYANEQILSYASENNCNGMGTTVCLLLLQEKNAFIAHVGDSRIYLYLGKEKELHRLTKDHSYVQTLVDTGEMTDEDAEYYPRKSIVLNALGKYQEVTPTIDILQPKNDDVFLICNAMFKKMVWKGVVKNTLSQNISLEQKGEQMIELALSNKAHENFALQLIRIDNSPWNRSEFTSYNHERQNDDEIESHQKDENHNDDVAEKPKSKLSIEKILYFIVPLLIIMSCIIFANGDKDEKESTTTEMKTDDAVAQRNTTLSENVSVETEQVSATESELTDGQEQIVTPKQNSQPEQKQEVKPETITLSKPSTIYNKNVSYGITKIVDTGTEYEISYKVKKGDNVSEICQLFSCGRNDFRKWNNLKNDNIGAGVVYIIKKDKGSVECKIHTIKKNEILVNIAKKNNVKMDDMIAYNGLKDPNSLAIGQKLVLIVKK